MESSKVPWGWIIAMAYVALAPLAIGILAFWPHAPEIAHHLVGQTAAAWAQALGGFVAVVGAIVIATNEARERKARERDAQRNAFIAALVIADSAFETVVTVVQNFSRPHVRAKIINDPNQLSVIDFFERDLLNFPYATLADAPAIAAFHGVRLAIWSIQKGLLDMKPAMAGGTVSAGVRMTPDEVAKFCQERLSDIDAEINRMAERAIELKLWTDASTPAREGVATAAVVSA